jgi:hypothetical protein
MEIRRTPATTPTSPISQTTTVRRVGIAGSGLSPPVEGPAVGTPAAGPSAGTCVPFADHVVVISPGVDGLLSSVPFVVSVPLLGMGVVPFGSPYSTFSTPRCCASAILASSAVCLGPEGVGSNRTHPASGKYTSTHAWELRPRTTWVPLPRSSPEV